jgi:hypothetical protein
VLWNVNSWTEEFYFRPAIKIMLVTPHLCGRNAHGKKLIVVLFYAAGEIHMLLIERGNRLWFCIYQILKTEVVPQFTALIVIGLL